MPEKRITRLLVLNAVAIAIAFAETASGYDDPPQLESASTVSKLDGETQPILYWAPAPAKTQKTPLFVFLHSWSSDYKQDNSKWLRGAVEQRWIFLHPNFRGANLSPKACGSKFARQDVLDAMRWAKRQFQVDPERIYLCGVSGGGHMTMLMAAHHPEEFSAASAWVGISDLAEWHRFHTRNNEPTRYAKMIVQCFGAPPGSSAAVDQSYRDRSPLFHIHQVGDLPVDIFAGVNDGHTGSVPVSHSLLAFNKIAEAHGASQVSEQEMQQLWTKKKLSSPQSSDLQPDASLGREIKLRRTASKSRVTIFEGGHESVPSAAFEWLGRHRRMTGGIAK